MLHLLCYWIVMVVSSLSSKLQSKRSTYWCIKIWSFKVLRLFVKSSLSSPKVSPAVTWLSFGDKAAFVFERWGDLAGSLSSKLLPKRSILLIYHKHGFSRPQGSYQVFQAVFWISVGDKATSVSQWSGRYTIKTSCSHKAYITDILRLQSGSLMVRLAILVGQIVLHQSSQRRCSFRKLPQDL